MKITPEKLAVSINRSHEAVLESHSEMIRHALAAGEGLWRAKEIIPHGAFERFIADNFTFSLTSARRYMSLVTYWPQLTKAMGEVEALKLSLEAAFRFIKLEKKPKPKITCTKTTQHTIKTPCQEKAEIAEGLQGKVLRLEQENSRLRLENMRLKVENSQLRNRLSLVTS